MRARVICLNPKWPEDRSRTLPDRVGCRRSIISAFLLAAAMNHSSSSVAAAGRPAASAPGSLQPPPPPPPPPAPPRPVSTITATSSSGIGVTTGGGLLDCSCCCRALSRPVGRCVRFRQIRNEFVRKLLQIEEPILGECARSLLTVAALILNTTSSSVRLFLAAAAITASLVN